MIVGFIPIDVVNTSLVIGVEHPLSRNKLVDAICSRLSFNAQTNIHIPAGEWIALQDSTGLCVSNSSPPAYLIIDKPVDAFPIFAIRC